MGWSGWFSGNYSSGTDGSSKDVQINIKTNDDGDVTDTLVSHDGDKGNHDHYYENDTADNGVVVRTDLSK